MILPSVNRLFLPFIRLIYLFIIQFFQIATKLINFSKEPNDTNQGMTLLLSLLITSIISMILLAEFLHIGLNEKNLAAVKQYESLFYAVDKKMHYWIHDEIKHHAINQACLVPLRDPNYYPKALYNKTRLGCSFTLNASSKSLVILYYVIEDLDVMPCTMIQNQAAHFYRMSVLGEDSLGHLMVLQAVYVMAGVNITNTTDYCSNEDIKMLSEGQCSWRISVQK